MLITSALSIAASTFRSVSPIHPCGHTAPCGTSLTNISARSYAGQGQTAIRIEGGGRLSKYKFDLAPKVKGIVEWHLEHYHEDKAQLESLKNDMVPSPTPGYSLTGGVSGGNQGMPTESAGIKIATNSYILATERNIKAIDRVLGKIDNLDKQMIDLVYWKKAYTIVGAGTKVGLKEQASYAHINTVLGLIALEMGLVNI